MKAAIVFCIALIFDSVVLASELNQLQLFYDPTVIASPPQILIQKPQTKNHTAELQSIPKAARKRPEKKIIYNGFISTRKTNHFYVNGRRLDEDGSFELVRVLDGGRSLELLTNNGNKFQIRIGQVIRVSIP